MKILGKTSKAGKLQSERRKLHVKTSLFTHYRQLQACFTGGMRDCCCKCAQCATIVRRRGSAGAECNSSDSTRRFGKGATSAGSRITPLPWQRRDLESPGHCANRVARDGRGAGCL